MDKILSVYWFVIIGLVATAIILMVFVFHNSPYDVRDIEARFLANKIADCISSQGKLNELLYGDGKFRNQFENNFLSICNINLNVEDTWSESQHYFNVEIFNASNTQEPVFFIEKGNLNFLPSCVIQEDKEYKNLAKCTKKRFYSTAENNQFLIKILTAVRKSEKNVN